MQKFQVLYDRNAERKLSEAKINIFAYEKRCKQYVDMLSLRHEAMVGGDESLFNYAFSLSFDKEKHVAHDKAAAAVREMVETCIKVGVAPIYTGDLNDRQAIGAFVCMFTGEPELAKFAD